MSFSNACLISLMGDGQKQVKWSSAVQCSLGTKPPSTLASVALVETWSSAPSFRPQKRPVQALPETNSLPLKRETWESLFSGANCLGRVSVGITARLPNQPEMFFYCMPLKDLILVEYTLLNFEIAKRVDNFWKVAFKRFSGEKNHRIKMDKLRFTKVKLRQLLKRQSRWFPCETTRCSVRFWARERSNSQGLPITTDQHLRLVDLLIYLPICLGTCLLWELFKVIQTNPAIHIDACIKSYPCISICRYSVRPFLRQSTSLATSVTMLH